MTTTYIVCCQFSLTPFTAKLSRTFTDIAEAYNEAIAVRKIAGATFSWIEEVSPCPLRF